MARLDIFIQEIENRKEREISLLESTLVEKKTEIKHKKENAIKELQEQYIQEAKVKSQKESARIVEAAKLTAKKILFEAINTNMDYTFDIIKKEMKNYVKTLSIRIVSKKNDYLCKKYFGF